MFKNFWSVLFTCLIISACNPSSGQPTLTTVAVQNQTVSAAPAATSTPSPTITPTFTPTLIPTTTPSPTPLGGGSGVIVFVANPFYQGPHSDEDGIYTVNADGSNLKQVFSRSQIETMIGKKYENAGFYSNAGQYYISADTLYSVTNDWKLVKKIGLPYFQSLFGFSPDGKFILYQKTDEYKYISTMDGLETTRLFGESDYYTGLSADGSTVYFRKNRGVSQGAIDTDGSNKRELPMTALEGYKPYEGVPLPEGVISINYQKVINTYAVSLDKTQVAFTWGDLLFTGDATDIEFSNPHFVTQLPKQAYKLVWSPDGNYLLVGLYLCENSSCNPGNIVIVDILQNSIDPVFLSTEYKDAVSCGFSPDSHQVIFRYSDWSARKSWIVLYSLDSKLSTTLIEYDGYIDPYRGCPTWLSTN